MAGLEPAKKPLVPHTSALPTELHPVNSACILADSEGRIKPVIKKIVGSPLFWIFILAFFLRIYKLGTFPVGFHVDEVKVGWNALSILKTGRDDKGNLFSLYYNSFGDFRPTGIFYATIPSIIAFSRNEFAVRFPSALLGALTIFPLYFLVLEINKDKNKKLALVAALLLSLSPWHISVSRATSEVVISMFMALWGLYYFLKGLDTKNKKDFTLSVLLIVVSYFFYHSIRILAPIFLFAIIFYKKAFYNKKAILSLGAISFVTLILLLNKEARGRFSQVSIFNDLDVQYELSRMPFEEGPGKVFIARMFHNKPLVYARRFVNEYTKYFSSNFFLDSTTPKPARYQTVGIGLLTYVELTLLIIGVMAIAQKKFSFLPLLLLLLAPFAAALTTEDSPNLHRALLMLPLLSIIEAYGFIYLWKFKKIIFTLLILNFIFFLHMYFIHNKVHLPLYRNVGAKELAVYLNTAKDNYDKIILTNIPDSPYPWIAFFTGKAPDQRYIVSGQRCPSRDAFEKPDVKRLLVVDAEGCATESKLKDRSDVKLINVIKRPDETEVYNIWSKID